MLTCLDNLVGIDKRCSPQESLSGYYLNDLSSFSLKIAAATMGSEATGPVQFAQKLLTLAQDDIAQKFRMHLAPYMKVSSLIANETLGYLPEVRETLAVTKLGGWKIKIRSGDYLKFDLHSVTLFWNTTATVDVKVYNLLTGNLLDTFSVNVVANVPTEKIVSKSYSGNNILLGIVTAGSGQPFRINYGGCTSCPHSTTYGSFQPAEIASGAAITDANMTGLDHAYGMSLNYSISCDVEPFICNMSNQLAWPLREAAAAHLFTAVLGEMERWNTYVTVERKKADFWQQYHEGRYTLAMDAILKNLSVPECICFYCNSAVKKVTVLP